MINNDLSRLMSAPDADTPETWGGGGGGLQYFGGSGSGAPVDIFTSSSPLAEMNMAASPEPIRFADPGTATTPPIVVPNVPLPSVSITGPSRSFWQKVVDFVTLSVPAAVSGSYARLKTKFSGSSNSGTTVSFTASATGATSGSSSGSSWMLWALLAGAAAAIYFATKGKGKGGKSIFPKFGGKPSVKLH